MLNSWPYRVPYAALGAGVVLIALMTGRAEAARLIVGGEAIGNINNNFSLEAGNIVRYAFANGKPAAAHEFAVFQNDSNTIVKDAISANGHTFTAFSVAQLSGFNFSDYRVVILNWDNSPGDLVADPTAAAIPGLEAYVADGGTVWIQGAIRYDMNVLATNSFALPFGGTQANDGDFYMANWIIDAANPMMAGLGPNPISNGEVESTSHSTGYPAGARIVKRAQDENGVVTLYEYEPPVFANGFETQSLARPTSITRKLALGPLLLID